MGITPFWAKEQLALRKTFEAWVTEEIDCYQAEGFQALVGDKTGHALDEVGGYTREFTAAYALSGDRRISAFMKAFRNDWREALAASGHFWHGYDSNEEGDYLTHTAEAFTQFLLNVLYLDPADPITIEMVEDAAEHIGNYSPEVHDWYDWDSHLFHSYFLGTKMNDFYGTPWNWQSGSHFRLLTIAVAAYDVTGNKRYLDVATDYCDMWAEAILAAESDDDIPMSLHPYSLAVAEATYEQCLTGKIEPQNFATPERVLRYGRYFLRKSHREKPPRLRDSKANGIAYKHGFHDTVMTWLDLYRQAPRERHAEALARIMRGWVSWTEGEEQVTQLSGQNPHCALHYPKYRDVTGDTSLDEQFLSGFPDGIGAYLVSGEVDCFLGHACAAEAVFTSTVRRNRDENLACTHACNIHSNAGTTSAYVAPALFMPVFGGLNVHYGRAPWVKVLYYTGGRVGLPPEVAALYVPGLDGRPGGVRLFNAGTEPCAVAARPVDMSKPTTLRFTEAAPEGIPEVTVRPGHEQEVVF